MTKTVSSRGGGSPTEKNKGAGQPSGYTDRALREPMEGSTLGDNLEYAFRSRVEEKSRGAGRCGRTKAWRRRGLLEKDCKRWETFRKKNKREHNKDTVKPSLSQVPLHERILSYDEKNTA